MAITYKLQKDVDNGPGDPYPSEYVFKIDSEVTDRITMVHKTENQEYVEWLAEGNEPDPADEVSE